MLVVLAAAGCTATPVTQPAPVVVISLDEPEEREANPPGVGIWEPGDGTFQLWSDTKALSDDIMKAALHARSVEVCHGAYRAVQPPEAVVTVCNDCGTDRRGWTSTRWTSTIRCESKPA